MNILRLALVFIINFSYIHAYCTKADPKDEERCNISVMPWMVSTAKICPKPSASSDLNSPKIGVKVNFSLWGCEVWGGCNYIKVDRDLEHGQCIYYPGLPTVRYCARIANKSVKPKNPQNPNVTTYQIDPGYTSGYNINIYSKWQDDAPIEYEQYIKSDASQSAKEKCLEMIESDISSEMIESDISLASIDKKLCDTCPTDKNSSIKDCTIKFKIVPIQSKMCLYQDPWMIDIPPDIFDYNPVYQPTHSGVESEAGRIVASIVEGGGDAIGSIVALLCKIFGKKAGEDIGKFFVKLIDLLGEEISIVINFILMPNKYAFPMSGGACVNVPLGPNPPSYCPTIQSNLDNLMTPIAEEICPTIVTSTSRNNNGVVTQQTLVTITPSKTYTETIDYTQNPPKSIITTTDTLPGTTKCVIPINPTKNNFIKNSIRLSYSWKLPNCKFNQLTISNSESDSNKLKHAADNKRWNAGACVRFAIATENLDGSGIGVNISDEQLKTGLIPASLVSIKNASSAPSQSFYRLTTKMNFTQVGTAITTNYSVTGIDIGEFKDVEIDYIVNDQDSKIQTLQLHDINNKTKDYKIVVYGDDISNPYTNSICAYNKSSTPEKLIRCFPRAKAPQVQIYECKSKTGGVNCISNSTFQNPSAILGMKIGPDEIYQAIDKNSIQNTLKLAGLSIKSFITDKNFTFTPFDKTDIAHVIKDINNPNKPADTIIGNYYPAIDNASTVSVVAGNLPKIADHKYLSGLEYRGGKYIYGGTYLCLNNSQDNNCPSNPKNCVLSKVQEEKCINANKCIVNSQYMTCPSDSKDWTSPEMKACCSNQTKEAGKFEKLCVASANLQDRIWPTPPTNEDLKEINKLILNDRQCYTPVNYRNSFTAQDAPPGYSPGIERSPCELPNTTQPFYSIDDNTSTSFALRNKNAVEQGLCISVPQPQPCQAIIDSDGTSWPTTEYGQKANGSCNNGSIGNPERYCFINVDTGITSFGDIINPCKSSSCKQLIENGITWPETKVGSISTSPCQLFLQGSQTRPCELSSDKSSAQFGKITSSCINFGFYLDFSNWKLGELLPDFSNFRLP